MDFLTVTDALQVMSRFENTPNMVAQSLKSGTLVIVPDTLNPAKIRFYLVRTLAEYQAESGNAAPDENQDFTLANGNVAWFLEWPGLLNPIPAPTTAYDTIAQMAADADRFSGDLVSVKSRTIVGDAPAQMYLIRTLAEYQSETGRTVPDEYFDITTVNGVARLQVDVDYGVYNTRSEFVAREIPVGRVVHTWNEDTAPNIGKVSAYRIVAQASYTGAGTLPDIQLSNMNWAQYVSPDHSLDYTPVTQTASFTAELNKAFPVTGTAVTVTLPDPVEHGDKIYLWDINAGWNTDNITVDGGSNLIEGLPTFTLDAQRGTATLIWNATGNQWEIILTGTGSGGSGGIGQTYENVFVGDGTETDFALSNQPNTITDLSCYVGGVLQSSTNNDYTLAGQTVTFTTAPPNGVDVIIKYGITSTSILDGSITEEKLDPALPVAYRAMRTNYMVNGNFDLWQSGTSFTTPDFAVTADRWLVDTFGTAAGVATVTRENFTTGQTDVPNEPAYYLRIDQTVAVDASITIMRQLLPDVRTLAGQEVTISFYAKDGGQNREYDVRVIQNFGTGGSAANIQSFGQAVLSNAWQKFTFTITVPSISGATIGTDSYLEFSLGDLGAKVIHTTDFAQFQLETGDTATTFEQRDIEEERLLVGVPSDNPLGFDPALNNAKSGRKNYLINGDFRINQRNPPSSISTSSFTVDRFSVRGPTGGTVDWSWGQTSTQHGNTVTITAGGANTQYTALIQQVEGLPKEGQVFTLSFYFTPTVTIDVVSVLNTIDSTNGLVQQPPRTQTVTAGVRTKVEVTFDPVAGFDTASNDPSDGLYLEIRLDATATPPGSYTFEQVQLEEGFEATDFEYRPIAEELALCQRYFFHRHQWRNLMVIPNTTTMVVQESFPTTMRTSPTVTIGTNTGTVTPSFVAPRPDGVEVHVAMTANVSANVVVSYTADAEL